MFSKEGEEESERERYSFVFGYVIVLGRNKLLVQKKNNGDLLLLCFVFYGLWWF